jgi:hypothetical protein
MKRLICDEQLCTSEKLKSGRKCGVNHDGYTRMWLKSLDRRYMVDMDPDYDGLTLLIALC